MSTPSIEYLNSMWQYIPQGHEKPLKHAFYNAIANIFIFVAAGVFVGVYFILAPFVRPLYWAVLCGTFLYPFKRSLTSVLRSWLKSLHSSGTPLAVGTMVLPFQVANNLVEALTHSLWANLKLLLGVFFGLPLVYLLYHFAPLQYLCSAVCSFMGHLSDFMAYFNTLWVWTLFISYLLLVVFLWTPGSQHWLRVLTIPVWSILVLHIANIAGPLRVPLLILMVVVMAVGFLMELDQATQQSGGGEEPSSPSLRSKLCSALGFSVPGQPQSATEQAQSDSGDAAVLEEGPVMSPPSDSSKPQGQKHTPSNSGKPQSLKLNTDVAKVQEESKSRQYFVALLYGHIIVRVWIHSWLVLLLLLLPLVHTLAKKIVAQFGPEGMFHPRVESARSAGTQWLEARREVLMPRGLRGLGRLARNGDRKIVSVLEQSLDSATSVLFILMLLVGTFLFTLLGAAQVQRESMYMITTTQNALNNTEMSQWMPDQDAVRTTMDQVLHKTHEYGRNFIASKVKEFVNAPEEDQENLVNQVLEVWDRVYESMLSTTWGNHSSKPQPALPQLSDVDGLWQMLSQGQFFQVSALVEFVKENLGTFVSVLESVWAVLKGNMTLVTSVVTSVLSAVLGGGTAILNFVISAIIFLTALFYLLASSGDMYKPAELFSTMSPGSTGNRFGQAVEEAISGVFKASLKMASFYGLYTWLIHLVFGLDIVFIPSALAALFAAVPFLGPYWAAIPAVIELWLVQGQGLNALLLFVCHMVPSYVVDTAIYSEIKGGHPYVTGLAIAGGMLCMGLEGAIIGPIILCCLIVVLNMYSTMLKADPSTPNPQMLWPKRLRSISCDALPYRGVTTPLARPDRNNTGGDHNTSNQHSDQHSQHSEEHSQHSDQHSQHTKSTYDN